MSQVCTTLTPIDDLKAWLNITDSTHDAELGMMMAGAIKAIENYLNRFLPKCEYTEHFTSCDSSGDIQLHALPVESITSVAGVNGAAMLDYGTLTSFGSLCRGGVCNAGGIGGDVTVTYIGGFEPIPADIMMVFLNMMSSAWAAKGSAATAGQVKSETVFGVAKVEYVVDSGGESSGGKNPAYPGYYAEILAPYRIIES